MLFSPRGAGCLDWPVEWRGEEVPHIPPGQYWKNGKKEKEKNSKQNRSAAVNERTSGATHKSSTRTHNWADDWNVRWLGFVLAIRRLQCRGTATVFTHQKLFVLLAFIFYTDTFKQQS